jgi:hypothetical protein
VQQGYDLNSISNQSSKYDLKRSNRRGETWFVMIREMEESLFGLDSSRGGITTVSWVWHGVSVDMWSAWRPAVHGEQRGQLGRDGHRRVRDLTRVGLTP